MTRTHPPLPTLWVGKPVPHRPTVEWSLRRATLSGHCGQKGKELKNTSSGERQRQAEQPNPTMKPLGSEPAKSRRRTTSEPAVRSDAAVVGASEPGPTQKVESASNQRASYPKLQRRGTHVNKAVPIEGTHPVHHKENMSNQPPRSRDHSEAIESIAQNAAARCNREPPGCRSTN